MCCTVAAFAASCGVVARPAAELLVNGSFEDVKDGKTVGWNVPEHYAFADGVGMNGTRGILFENRDDRKYYRYPSAYRNLAADGKVQFRAAVNLKDIPGIEKFVSRDAMQMGMQLQGWPGALMKSGEGVGRLAVRGWTI